MTALDWVVDAVIAAGAFGFGCLQLTMAVNLLVPDEAMRRLLGIEAVVPTLFAIMVVALTTVPLAFRRRLPWPVFVITLLIWAFFQVLLSEVSLSLVGPLVALFTLAYVCSHAEALAGTVATVLVLLVVPTAAQSWTLASLTLAQNVSFVLAVAFAGYALHTHRDFLAAAEQRAAEAERTRESEAERRVEAERVRIAREVHDITAHSLSAVSIQAAAAERLIDADPAAAKESIATVRKTAKDALEEMRAMIGVLRSGEAVAETAPTEGTDHLEDLAAYLRRAGVSCTLDVAGFDCAAVPAYIDVALFGIAREATTNIVRHAQASHARIALRSSGAAPWGSVTLEVSDDGRGFDYGATPVAGHGLEGMRERAHVLGGSFTAQRLPEGGFSVCVTIPLGTAKEGDQHGR